MKLLRFIGKIICLPLILLLSLLIHLMNLGMKAYGIALSLFYLVLGICFVIAVCTAQWNKIGVMAIILAVTFIISFVVALITFVVEALRDKLKGFVFA